MLSNWSRERWAATAAAVLMTIALPIAIDQGYFRHSIYALPCLGLIAAVLYVFLFVTSSPCKSLFRWLCAVLGERHQAAGLIIADIIIVSAFVILTLGFWLALKNSGQHVADLRKAEAGGATAAVITGTERPSSPPENQHPRGEGRDGAQPPRLPAPPSIAGHDTKHARLWVIDVQLAKLTTGEPAFNVFYANRSAVPAKGFLRSYAVRIAKEELDPTTLLKIQNWNDRRGSSKALADMNVEYQEMYNGDAPNFFTVAGHVGEESRLLSQNIDQVHPDSDTRIYIFTSMIYRDSYLPPHIYGVTETCFYYWQELNVRHDCGSRYIQKSFNDLVGRAAETMP